ncbi:hypothetical protein LPJ73_001768 [Coemansia sp. RSA 2703]|nr:hypothetical protein LPJ73_001768 [Coemansia sp. RSA 2703]
MVNAKSQLHLEKMHLYNKYGKRCIAQMLSPALILVCSFQILQLATAGALPPLVNGLGVLSQPGDASTATLPGIQVATPPERQGEGTLPSMPQIRMSSSDTLSDTKIFVLLASIVFIFLIALGVAMARVSRNRSRHQTERVRQQIISAQRPPETLNKTILDLLPVYEVTEKRQLRRVHAFCSPKAVTNDCFVDNCSDCDNSPRATELANVSNDSMSKIGPQQTEIVAGGYDLESISSHSFDLPATGGYCREFTPESQLKPMAPMVCNDNGDMELSEWQSTACDSKMPGDWSHMCHKHRSSHPIEPPSPVAAVPSRHNVSRYGRTSASSKSVSPSTSVSARHSSTGYSPNQLLPSSASGYQDMYINTGSVAYNYQSSRSRSLDLGSQRSVSAETKYTAEPETAWLIHSSQPAIARRQSHFSVAASDGGNGGLGACPICLEEFDVGEHVRELPCKHKYHVICIDTWLVSRSTCCPYCKLDIRRWYYGPSLEDGLTRPGSLVNTSNRPFDYSEHLPSADTVDDSTENRRRSHRRLRRSNNRRSRHSEAHGGNVSRWDQFWTAMRVSGPPNLGHFHV